MKDHSLAEIRVAALNVLTEGVGRADDCGQYINLRNAVAAAFTVAEPAAPTSGRISYQMGYGEPRLSNADANLLLEVFWGLVREGIICPGMNDSNLNLPFFRVTQWGRSYLAGDSSSRFQDGASYVALLKRRVPNVDLQTLNYAGEAGSSLAAGCFLAAGLTLSFAVESALAHLMKSLEGNSLFTPMREVSTPAKQLEMLLQIVQNNPQLVGSPASDDLETQLAATVAIIRRFRENSNRPNGQNIDREDCTQLLQLFVPCCRKIYQLKEALT